jgi:hypothetical protein
MKKFLIHYSGSIKTESIPNWTTVDNPDEDVIFAKENNIFADAEVVLLEVTKEDGAMVLLTARELMSIAKVVKLLTESDPGSITEKVLDSARAIPQSLLNIEEKNFATLATLQSAQVLHPAQDYQNGEIFYGSIINGVDMLVTSKGEMFPFADTVNRNIDLMQKELSVSHLRHETVIHFFKNGVRIVPDEIFSSIREYIRKHIFFPDPETYDLVTIWVMGTYIYRGFRYYPYLHLNAEKGSGKTLLMELMMPLSFNGVMMSQPVASTVLKLISHSGATLFIDEAEGLSQRKTGGGTQIKQILKTGFGRGGQYYIGDTLYRTYGPKCFAGINEIDDVLADRAITIKMMRKTGAERVAIYRETPTMLVEQMSLRDSLYLYGLQYGPEIIIDYEQEKPFYDKLNVLSNRAYDVWVPLYRMVNAFRDLNLKNSVFNSMDKLSHLDSERRSARDAEENETGSLIESLNEILAKVDPFHIEGGIKYYEPDLLHNAMLINEKIPKSMHRKAFSRLLKRVLEIECSPRSYLDKTKRMYAVDTAKFEDYKKRYADSVSK